jgi:chromosome segregation ATPase
VNAGLAFLESLTSSVASIEKEVTEAFERHRKLAVNNSGLNFDFQLIKEKYDAEHAGNSQISADLEVSLSQVKELSQEIDSLRAEFDILLQREHLLNIAKKEAEESISDNLFTISSMQSEIENLELNNKSLLLQVESDATRTLELSSGLLEANQTAVLLAKRCESFEVAISTSTEALFSARDLGEKLSRENEDFAQKLLQREQEVAQLRSEMSRLFEKNQHDFKLKDREILEYRTSTDSLTSRVQMLEQVNASVKAENEKILAELISLKEANKQLEITAGTLERKLSRSSASLDSVRAAKSQVEQARTAVTSRLENTLQSLRAREIDVKRLENELAQQMADLDDQNALQDEKLLQANSQIQELRRILILKQDQINFLESNL